MIPWVAGCDGPIEIVCVSKCPARSSVSDAQSGIRRSSSAKNQRWPGGVVLAQRVPDERVVAEEPPQVRMAREVEAEEVERLPLEPVRRGPDVDTVGRLGGSPSGRSTLTRMCSLWTASGGERRPRSGSDGLAAQVVHAGEVEEEVEPASGSSRRNRASAGQSAGGTSIVGRSRSATSTRSDERGRRRGGRGASRRGGTARRFRRCSHGRRGPRGRAAVARHLARAIFRWSSRIPYMSCSGVGGQPGT